MKYSADAFTWVKPRRSTDPDQFLPLTESDLHVGLGLTDRNQTEIVLLGRRGNCRRTSKDVREVILAPVREHSRKPDEFYAASNGTAADPIMICSRASAARAGTLGRSDRPVQRKQRQRTSGALDTVAGDPQ